MKRSLVLIPILLLVFAASGAGRAAAAGSDQFTLSGDFSGLYPNADVTVPVLVHNPQTYDLAVRAASVVVRDASPGCPAANVVAHSFSGDIVVPAGSTATIPIRMQMLASAPNACQGVTFPLTFDAHGEILNPQIPSIATNSSGPFAFTGFGSGGQVLAAIGITLLALGLLLASRRSKIGDEVRP